MSVNVIVTPWMNIPVTLEEGRQEFAVGDSHGMSDLLDGVLGSMRSAAGDGSHITFLGDMTDRGPDSLGCLEAASRSAESLGFSGKTVLLGNHEIMLLLALSDTRAPMRHWLLNGGAALLTQLGIDPEQACGNSKVPELIRSGLGEAVMRMLETAVSHREAGRLLFVHAGINPAVPIDRWFARPKLHIESENHWAWIRFPFLGHEGGFEGGRLVIHGHTPEHITLKWKDKHLSEMHLLDGHRIGLDGGSYMTNRVAGAEFVGGRYRLYLAMPVP